MRNLRSLLQREPAALGSVVASLIPVLVLTGLVPMDEEAMAATVVFTATTVGFGVRLFVSPVAAPPRRRRRRRPSPADVPRAHPTGG